MEQKHLVVIGNGMAGMACVDQILKRKPNFRITVLSEEPYYNYNRILLSSVLAGEKQVDEIYINSREWYEQNKIALHLMQRVIEVDSKSKKVYAHDGTCYEYDSLLIATGSNPFVPPIEGVQKEGVYTFRNMEDTNKIIQSCETAREAVVIGGGLLGLEAARGIANRGVKVTVVHLMDRLMDMQVDETGGQFLKREIEKMGITVLLNKNTEKIMGQDKVEGVQFKDGHIVTADMVVVACGIRPNTELGKKADYKVENLGSLEELYTKIDQLLSKDLA